MVQDIREVEAKREPVGNIPFTSAEMQEEAKINPKFRLMNTEPNRAARRIKDNAGKLLNNRKKTKGRKGNNVLIKMSHFALWLHYHQSGMYRTA